MQPGDVVRTYADVESLTKVTGHKPDIAIEIGLANFVDWYLDWKL